MHLAAVLLAIDPVGLGGVVLRSSAGPARERWLSEFEGLLPEGTPWRRVPLHIDDDRLLGGLDLPATLQSGRPVAQRGLLAEADGGVLLLAMAERLSPSTAGRLAAVLDQGSLAVERHGLQSRHACRVGVVALDEGLEDEHPPAALIERLALQVELVESHAPESAGEWSRDDVLAARARLADVSITDDVVEGLCAAARALGIDSLRAPLLACRVARLHAALAGRDLVSTDDAALAASLVLAPRATRMPSADSPTDESDDEPSPRSEGATSDSPVDPPAPSDASDADHADHADDDRRQQGAVDDLVLQAALASLPPHLLAKLSLGERRIGATASIGKAGATRESRTRGRPIGTRSGLPGGGARLAIIETLRAAAPWQGVRRREAAAAGRIERGTLQIRREDFRVWRYRQRSETTTVFVIDASGSSALHRLAEAKGAVELLLADCYARRDSVAVIAFRGPAADVLLPPTRSLARAKRSLAGLPGGGGTPLAAAIDAAVGLGLAIRRHGATPLVVLLTDGRANIARDGTPGRARATDDARSSARQLRNEGLATLLLDTSAQPQASARQLAEDMAARYLPLPHAGAVRMSQAVREAADAALVAAA